MREKLTDRAREIVLELVLQKLGDQGIDCETFPVEQFYDYLALGNGDDFRWDYEGSENSEASVELTSDDEETLQRQLDDLVRNGEDIFQDALWSGAKALVRAFVKEYDEYEVGEDVELYAFRRSIEYRWGKPLNLFRVMLASAHDIYLDHSNSLSRSRAKKGLHLREALLGIQARALRTSTAVLVLLENGLADDAYARWRTLYELSVVSAFLSLNGDQAAERYLDHECVSLKKRMDKELSWGAKDIPKRQQRDFNRAYEAALKKYGDDFSKDYGWACPFLTETQRKSPRFIHLEESIIGKHVVPPYKEASFQVHAGRAGLLGLSSLDNTEVAGRSEAGIEIPLMHSALCLMKTTNLLMYHGPSMDLVILHAMMVLEKRIAREATKIARELHKEFEDSGG
ncbi:MAG: DUF5677 domain-containing protein [Gammaproteobacteria bacterium]|nr:DUF5677 domain-containing protein [Gammaproteobacteria bacterium]